MQNLLIYINPSKFFDGEHEELTKMQIDNSLSLGWKPEEILLVTNFDYEYEGIRSIKVSDYKIFDQNRSTKIPAINELFTRGIIKDDEIYWFHDHDAFQLVPFKVDLGNKDAGFTDHGWSKRWNAGSFFFKKSSLDIFKEIWKYMELRNTNEQDALTYMWQINADEIEEKYQLMNIAYNINIYYIDKNIRKADLPLKVAHFHPHKRRHLDIFRSRNILPGNLLTIFRKYGI